MSKKIFTKDEIDKLSKNEYVKKVSEKGITYTESLKEYLLAKMKKDKHQK